VIGDGDLFVLEVAFVFEHVGQVGRHVEDVLDVVLAEHIQVGGVFGTAQVKVRQDLDRKRWLVVGERAALRLCGAARLTVGFPVWAVGADAESSQAEDGGRWRAAGTGAVQIGLAVLGVLRLELVKAPWTTRERLKKVNIRLKAKKVISLGGIKQSAVSTTTTGEVVLYNSYKMAAECQVCMRQEVDHKPERQEIN